MSGIIGKLLKRYDDREFVIWLKARFIAQCYIVELVVILAAILYTGYANLHNPIYGFKPHFQTLGVLTGGFALSILGLVIFVRGYYTISANLLMIIPLATAWTVIFTNQTHIVSRLDTIVFVIGLLSMMPIIILKRPYGMVFYAGINILVLYGFMFLKRDELNLPYSSFLSYLADNTFTILAVAIISYQIFMINRRALEKAERDIAVRKRAEAAKEEALQRYQALFKSKTTLVFVMDDQGHFIEANDLTLDLFGYDKEEFRRLNYFQLVHPDQDPEPIAMTALEILETGAQAEPLEIKLKSKNGKMIYVQSGGTLIPGKNEIIGVAQDITDQKSAEEARKKLEGQLVRAQKMEAIGTLAGGIAHDFNNILSAVIGYNELLQMQLPKDSAEFHYAHQIELAGIRAKDLVQQILAFSRQTEIEFKPVDISLIIHEVIKLLRSSLPTTIEIKQDIQSDSIVMGDPTQIHQILMNLCTNAGHAMKEQGGQLTISLKSIKLKEELISDQIKLAAGTYIQLSVSDTGHGISAEHLDRIFDPFFTTKGQVEGTGLGLSIVHGIVESHKGAIQVSSQENKGTVFFIYLPVVERRAEPDKRLAEEMFKGTEHILFVDDEPIIAEMCKSQLEALGYKVTSMSNGFEALAQFKTFPDIFDLIITDMTMPEMSGDELAKEIKRVRADIPIVLCTGFSNKITPKTAKQFDIDALLIKPVSLKEMAKVVRKLLDKKQCRDKT